ncbi:MAG TPA: rRNA maturation RNase YbeY [Patescibacteria group bacterium]|nr:rRNA maturation RNase YbeY [Patescibacteria group bacterium]
MVKVSVTKQSNYPVGTAILKKKLADFLAKSGIVSDAEVSIAIVGEKKMKDISKKYLKDDSLHNVLSFTSSEAKAGFSYPPGKIYLGEIVVCYPEALREAKKENMLIDDKVYALIEHGAMHLMGVHHKE